MKWPRVCWLQLQERQRSKVVLQEMKLILGCVSGNRGTAHTSKALSTWMQNVHSAGKEGDPDGIQAEAPTLSPWEGMGSWQLLFCFDRSIICSAFFYCLYYILGFKRRLSGQGMGWTSVAPREEEALEATVAAKDPKAPRLLTSPLWVATTYLKSFLGWWNRGGLHRTSVSE